MFSQSLFVPRGMTTLHWSTSASITVTRCDRSRSHFFIFWFQKLKLNLQIIILSKFSWEYFRKTFEWQVNSWKFFCFLPIISLCKPESIIQSSKTCYKTCKEAFSANANTLILINTWNKISYKFNLKLFILVESSLNESVVIVIS